MILACYTKNKSVVIKTETTSPPALPKKQKKTKYSILHNATGNPEATAAAHYPQNSN